MNTNEFLTEPRPHFAVDAQGAYLTELLDEGGTPILFSRTTIDGKLRGGCHVCLPNFNTDASGKLSRHGFGRDVTWQVVRDEPEVQELVMPAVAGEYAGLQAALRYTYGQESGPHLTVNLMVRNTGANRLRLAPAFHPYFAVNEGEAVVLNGQTLDLSQYEGTEYIDGTTHDLQIGKRQLQLHSGELQRWALWTDSQAGYFCVEPTLAGPSFASTDAARANEWLAPDAVQTYEFRIYW